ncbi:MAG: anthranilate synthase component I, partial [Psychrobium sp.]|nr:anthranilate synthase component I [Psychrobium sp.]
MIDSKILKSSCQYSQSPTELFKALTLTQDNVMLLESAEVESKDNLKSLLLISSALKITCHGRQVDFVALNKNGAALLPLL